MSATATAVFEPDDAMQALAECLWSNQTNLIAQAATHFQISPSLVALIVLPVLFQTLAQTYHEKEEFKRFVNETIDKGFEDWLRNTPNQGGVQ